MGNTNPVFKENTENYLRQLDYTQLSRWESILDTTVDEKRKTVQIPFFQRNYRVSPFGVVDGQGKRPDYGACVILLKYLLMCPLQVPNGKDWISFAGITALIAPFAGNLSQKIGIYKIIFPGLLICLLSFQLMG
jgi:hypothetical protein